MTPDEKKAELRMWIVLRCDLDMPAGKIAVQAGHAVASALVMAAGRDAALVQAYMDASQPKIAVRADSEADLRKVFDLCSDAGLPAAIIQDAARTVFATPTLTAVGVGPCRKTDLPPFVARLRLYEGPKAVPSVAQESET